MSEPTACEWCGRAIRTNEDGTWYAVKAAERGYDPIFCGVSEHLSHEPATSGGYPT